MDRKSIIYVAVIVVLAGLLRVGYCALGEGFHAPNRGVEADYHMLAKNIAAGAGFADSEGRPTALRSPAYPFILGAVYKVFGPHKIYGRFLQILLGTAVVFLVFFTSARYFDKVTAALAAALAAFNPFMIFSSGYLLAENLYTLLLLLGLYFVPKPENLTGKLRNPLLAGAFLAGAALTLRAAPPLAVWMLAAGIIFGAGPKRRRCFYGLLTAGLFLLILLPWSFRNQNKLGGWVGTTTSGGMEFYQGNNPGILDFKYYRGGAVPPAALPMYHRLTAASEVERDQMARRMGREFLGHNLRYAPKLAWWKFVRFWGLQSAVGIKEYKKKWWPEEESILRPMSGGFDEGMVYGLTVLPLFIAGIIVTRRRWKELLFLYGLVAVHTLTALVFFGSIRGRLPVEPVIVMFAAVTLTKMWYWARSRAPRGRS